ncbi:hypothetical protein Hanom_Chr16g01432181 [Helianthus anomalus]
MTIKKKKLVDCELQSRMSRVRIIVFNVALFVKLVDRKTKQLNDFGEGASRG